MLANFDLTPGDRSRVEILSLEGKENMWSRFKIDD